MDYLRVVQTCLADTPHWKRRSPKREGQIAAMIKRAKQRAVAVRDQDTAKLVWCYEIIHEVQSKYLKAFHSMKGGAFYDAWCLLERVEIDINSLRRHFTVNPDIDQFKISFIATHTELFQSLYPYKFFISPAMVHLEKVCSICRTPIRLRNPCPHRKGEIYDGEMCCHEITKFDVLELSIVTEPVQNYSVLFLSQEDGTQERDHYDYSLVRYVMRALRDPFDEWDVVRTKIRHPHSLFTHVPSTDPCPCGSHKPYKDCCLPLPGVLRPHLQVRLSVPPPEDLPRLVLPSQPQPP